MPPLLRMSKDQRRAAIIHSVKRVFAEKGFDRTTTRELADAAGVSEALLFKHFPTKEALFEAMLSACCSERDRNRFAALKSLDNSASTLVLMVHFLATLVIGKSAARDPETMVQNRLFLRSLCERGEFARLMLKPLASDWVKKIEHCHRAAVAAGDAAADPVALGLRGWFAHHLPAAVMLFTLPAEPAVDYRVSEKRMIEQIVWFCLRGIGLKDDTILRHYNPKALALLSS